MQDVFEGMLWIALGGALGGPARYFVSGFVGRHIGETFPWGTMVVNVIGCFAIGLIAAAPA
jgi:CrcB protein